MADAEATLEQMVRRCFDAAHHYRSAANHASEERLEDFFRFQAEARERAAAELRKRIFAMGGEPPRHGTLGGEMETLAIDLEANLGLGDSGLVEWCQEDTAAELRHFEEALAEVTDPVCREILERHLRTIKEAAQGLADLHKTFARG